MIKPMVVCFCFVGVCCQITCIVSEKWNVSRVISRLYGYVHEILRLYKTVDQCIIVVIAMTYYSGGYQFDAHEKLIFDSRVTKFVFEAFRVQFLLGWNTCLFFNSHIVNFVWESDEGEAGNILLIFVLWRCFNCWWVRVEAECLIWGQLKSHLYVPVFFPNWQG